MFHHRRQLALVRCQAGACGEGLAVGGRLAVTASTASVQRSWPSYGTVKCNVKHIALSYLLLLV